MDWFLSVSTLLSNSALGWTKGANWMWLLHAFNAFLWVPYAVHINQYGLVLLSVVTILIDVITVVNKRRKTCITKKPM